MLRFLSKNLALILIFANLLTTSPIAQAEETLEQLLEQVDQTLNQKSNPQPSDSPPTGKGTRSSRTRTPAPPSDSAVLEPKPPQPLSAPDLFELPTETGGVNRIEAPMRGRLVVGMIQRQLDAVGRLEKDDDTFVLDGMQSISGFGLSLDHEITQTYLGSQALSFFAGGGVSVFRGEANVLRRGIINEDIAADMTLIPWHIGVGSRYPANAPIFLELGVQVVVEAVNQTGAGITDTVSEILPADIAAAGIGFRFGRFAGLLGWQKRGFLLTGDNSSIPGQSVSLAAGTYL